MWHVQYTGLIFFFKLKLNNSEKILSLYKMKMGDDHRSSDTAGSGR